MKPSQEDNITPFTGNRHAPTPNDWKELEEFVQELANLVSAREINSVAWIGTLADKPSRTLADWLVLPGVEGHVLNSAMSIQQRDFELRLWNPSPTGEDNS